MDEVGDDCGDGEVGVGVVRDLAQGDGEQGQEQDSHGQAGEDDSAQMSPAVRLGQRPHAPSRIPRHQDEDGVVVGGQGRGREKDEK